ncbi:MAG: RNA-binding S4 domain-containing protein [Verrucomicrobia bacterium]|nr:RNA-binding S4 domain-containing protein [Verrucomicrobiota bacterium]
MTPSTPAAPAEVRVDKWLWSVRLFKTRSLAIEACQAGHVKIGGQRVKPSRAVHPGEIVTAQVGEIVRIVRVIALLDRRVGAAQVPQYLEDLTPPAPPPALRAPELAPLFHRPKGAGRPTKRDRRLLERMGHRADDPDA